MSERVGGLNHEAAGWTDWMIGGLSQDASTGLVRPVCGVCWGGCVLGRGGRVPVNRVGKPPLSTGFSGWRGGPHRAMVRSPSEGGLGWELARVYVSSTIVDLTEERRAVLDWLRLARHQAVRQLPARQRHGAGQLPGRRRHV